MSSLQRFSKDTFHACQDMYASWILGDDAGKSARLTLLLQADRRTNEVCTGLRLIEIHGRAYVQSVAPGTAAAAAGIQPQDAVQYATHFNMMMPSPHHNNSSGSISPSQTRSKRHHHYSNSQSESSPQHSLQQSQDAVMDDSYLSLAAKYVLDLEQKGLRTSYDELGRLLAHATDARQTMVSPPTTNGGHMVEPGDESWSGPPIPSTVCLPLTNGTTTSRRRRTRRRGRSRGSDDENDEDEEGSVLRATNSSGAIRPVVICFRRTRQRKPFFLPALAFRMDDECDFSCQLIRRLAPTADMELPPPDTWEEMVHDGTDWLLGRGSMLPPRKGSAVTLKKNGPTSPPTSPHSRLASNSHEPNIPLDHDETERARKLAHVQTRMAAEHARSQDRADDVEASTLRGMIQKAVGLAFVRASKIVLGVSVHGGSGIVLARLGDGTWSAPSAISTVGLGFGLQFGLEVAEYIFILQTPEALEHFKRGGSFTIGGNMGVAVAGLGREAYGAASVGGGCGHVNQVKDDEYNDDDRGGGCGPGGGHAAVNRAASSVAIAPIVAYAKSQGLYIGVSLEGSRISVRDDLNGRAYKFAANRDVTADDILSGRVATPPEAEELYAALHSVEFAHEMSCLPRPPVFLRKDSSNAWNYDRSTLMEQLKDRSSSERHIMSKPKEIFPFFSYLRREEAVECEAFETQFKNFMYGGVSVQRLLPDSEKSRRTSRERRILWLMLPEVGSLRLGFVSKLSDGEGGPQSASQRHANSNTVSNNNNTGGNPKNGTMPISNLSSTQRARREDGSKSTIQDLDLGTVGSDELTLDSALHTRDGSTIGPIKTGNVQLSSKHSVALTDVVSLSQEPHVPIRFKTGDKTEHLRVISIQDVSGSSLLFLANNFREAELLVCGLKLLLERETARLGVRGGLPSSAFGGHNLEGTMSPSAARGFRDLPSRPNDGANNKSPGAEQGVDAVDDAATLDTGEPRRWGSVPGRNYMRGQAATLVENKDHVFNEQGVPRYMHGQQIVRDLSKNVQLPLPLPLCRVLLLDSTSPVIRKWERDRGDKNFVKSPWTFPPATPRELERHASEHQLIASGSMCGAHRTTSFDRLRYGAVVQLSETHTVDADDAQKVAFTVTERNPRRGFSIKVRILLVAHKDNACDASVFAEIRPVGKDMSNQAAVHKAFLLVVDEIKHRYGTESSGGLLAGFLSVVDNMGNTAGDKRPSRSLFQRTNPLSVSEEKKSDHSSGSRDGSSKAAGLVSFDDMLKTGRESPETIQVPRPSTPSLQLEVPEPDPAKRMAATAQLTSKSAGLVLIKEPEDDPAIADPAVAAEPVLVEVKPLPKLRLSLMPAPREEDEEELNEPKKKKKSRSRSRSRRSSSRGRRL